MAFLPNLKELLALFDQGGGFSAAGQLPEMPEPKVKAKQQSVPSYLRTAKPTDSVLPQQDRRLQNTDIESYRNGTSSRAVIRDFAAASPDLSASLNAYLRTAITQSYTAVAKNPDGTFNREATQLTQSLLTRFDVLGDYSDGFSGISSIRSLSESLAKELLLYGAMAGELVLGKDRLPRQIAPVSVTTVQFIAEEKWLKPIQKVGADEIDLDIPTFFYVALDQDLTQAYASSPLEPAIQPVLFSTEFMNDLRRVVKKAIHPRLLVKIVLEEFKKNVPQDTLQNEEKLKAYYDSMISAIEGRINGLNPEDALVYFDMLEVDYMNNGNISLEAEYKTLAELIDAKMATGAKTPPSILGHGSGSQNIASSETLLFMKNAAGSVQEKLNEFYSKVLTLALRLFGLDVYVEFRYATIDLRPDSELESFKVMKQSRILEQLSLGLITDDEACLTLTGALPPAGMTPLSGTMFHQGAATGAGSVGNPYSNTSEGAANKATNPDTPQNPKGPVRRVK